MELKSKKSVLNPQLNSGVKTALMRTVSISLLITSLFGAGCSWADEGKSQVKRQPKKIANLAYVKDGSPRQTLDLYLPDPEAQFSFLDKKKPIPVIVWIHGGSWMYGDKTEDCIPARELSDHFAVASINYRLTTESPLPAQINDCKAAVKYLRANAKKYNLDPDRIGVWGTSAGAYLAALMGTTGDVEWMEGKIGEEGYSSRVQAVCDWSGPVNFLSAQGQVGPNSKFKFEGPGSAIYSLMGTNMHPMALLSASPINYITPDDPPFLIMHGDKDDAIPLAQAKEFYDALTSKGVRARFKIAHGKGHDIESPENVEIVRAFFLRNLGSKED